MFTIGFIKLLNCQLHKEITNLSNNFIINIKFEYAFL